MLSPKSLKRGQSLHRVSPLPLSDQQPNRRASAHARANTSVRPTTPRSASHRPVRPENRMRRWRIKLIRSQRKRERCASTSSASTRIVRTSPRPESATATSSELYLSHVITPAKKRKHVNLATVSFPELVATDGSFAENIVPEDPELKFTQVGDLFWPLHGLRPQRSVNPAHIDNGVVKNFFRSVFKRGPSKEAKQFCNRINAFIGMFNSMLQGEDFETASRKHKLFRKGSSKSSPDSVDVLNTLCNTLRENLSDAVTEGGLVIPALKNHDNTVAQIRKLQHILACNQNMLKVLVQIQTYNSLQSHNISLLKRKNNLRGIAQRIHSAMGLRDHRKKKLFNLAVTSGKHFGISVKDQPDAPIVVQAAMRFSRNMHFEVDPETLRWEQVPGYEHRIPYILTTLNRGLQEFDAFRMDNVFGVHVPQDKLKEMRYNIEKGYDTTVDHPVMLAALLKLWLEELPHPLMQLDGTDGMLMSEVLQGTHATDEQIQAVLAVNDERRITSVQRCVLEYVLNLLAVTVESLTENSEHNNPKALARQFVYPLCKKPADSRAGNLAIRFLEQCIRYQVKCRQRDPSTFVPCGSVTPVMRKFLTNMLVRADNMHHYLCQVEDLERQMPNETLIATVEGHAKTPEHKGESRGRTVSVDESLSGHNILEKTASFFHIPAGHLKPLYNEWKAKHHRDVSFQRFLAFHKSLRPAKDSALMQRNPAEWQKFFRVYWGRRSRARNNLLYNCEGKLFDTTGFTNKYVGSVLLHKFLDCGEEADTQSSTPKPMSTNFSGKEFLMCVYSEEKGLFCTSHKVGHWHHSSLLAGEDCMFAGELKVERGLLKVLTNKSGQYKTGELSSLKMLEVLLDKGFQLRKIKFIFVDKDYKETEYSNSMEFLLLLRAKYGKHAPRAPKKIRSRVVRVSSCEENDPNALNTSLRRHRRSLRRHRRSLRQHRRVPRPDLELKTVQPTATPPSRATDLRMSIGECPSELLEGESESNPKNISDHRRRRRERRE